MMVQQDDTSRQQVHPDPEVFDNSAIAEDDRKPRRNFMIVGTGVGHDSQEQVGSERDSIHVTKTEIRASIEAVEDVDAEKLRVKPNINQQSRVDSGLGGHKPSNSQHNLSV